MSTDLRPTVDGYPLDVGQETFGELRRTSADSPPEVIRARIAEDGYVYLPGFFYRPDVLEVRRELIARLVRLKIARDGDPLAAHLADGGADKVRDLDNFRELARGNEPLTNLLYRGRLIEFWTAVLGGEVRHFDFTWIRATPPGMGTPAHTDVVFMGRGTRNLYTCWVPYGDIPPQLGGLAILEGGHRQRRVLDEYVHHDVDTYCENLGEVAHDGFAHEQPLLETDAARLRQEFGGRWLTTSYRAGDLLAFGMTTAHVGIDNATDDELRLSSDSRYQLASEDIDERWIGAEPVGHGAAAKKGIIC